MKNTFKTIAILLIVLFSSGCAAYHTGYMTNSVALNSANFKYTKKNIKGESLANYFLILGSTKTENLVGKAKENMTETYPLGDNQALSNITVNFTSSTFPGIFSSVKCTVTADVVEFK